MSVVRTTVRPRARWRRRAVRNDTTAASARREGETMSDLEQAARALIALWDAAPEGANAYTGEVLHEAMVRCMSACKGAEYGRRIADAIALLDAALPD